jgi:hypothetical protein
MGGRELRRDADARGVPARNEAWCSSFVDDQRVGVVVEVWDGSCGTTNTKSREGWQRFPRNPPHERILCGATPKMSVFFLCKGSCYRGDGTKTSDKPVRFLWFSSPPNTPTHPVPTHTHTHTPISYTMFARVRLLHSRTSRHPCHVPFGTTTPSQQRPILQVFSRQFTSAVIRTASRTNLRQRMCFLARSSSSFVRSHFSPRGSGGVVDTRGVAFFFVFLLFLTHGGLPHSFSPCVFSSTDASTLLNRGGNTTARASGPMIDLPKCPQTLPNCPHSFA